MNIGFLITWLICLIILCICLCSISSQERIFSEKVRKEVKRRYFMCKCGELY